MMKNIKMTFIIMLIGLIIVGCSNVQLSDNQSDIAKNIEVDDNNSINEFDGDNYKNLSSIPDKYTFDMAKEDGYVVWSHNELYNIEKLDDFIINVENEIHDMVRVVSYTKEGDAIIMDLKSTGDGIKYTRDSTRDKYSSNPRIITKEYNEIAIERRYSEHYNGEFIEYMLIGDKEEKELILQILDNKDKELGQETDADEESGLEILSKIFPSEVGFTWFYHGYAEYGHVMSIVDINKEDKSYNIDIKGYMNDGMEDPDPDGRRTFTINYDINSNRIKEHIINNENNSNNLNSIISNKTILKLPLEEGNSWEDTFSYEGKSYNASSVIEEARASTNEDIISQEYVVRTMVNDIEDFPNNTYVEKLYIEKVVG